MPIDPMGISFSPTGDSQQNNAQKPTPVQQAIQTLSLRIPRTVGAASGAPQQLLQGQGGAGLGGNPNAAMTLEALIRRLFGGGAGLPMPGGGAPGGGDPGGGGAVPSPIVGFPAPPRAGEQPPTPGPTFPVPPSPGGRAPEEPYTPPPAPAAPPHLGPGVGPPRAPGKGWI